MTRNEEVLREVRRRFVDWQEAVYMHGETSEIARRAHAELESAEKEINQGETIDDGTRSG